jgi:hypothetical protein
MASVFSMFVINCKRLVLHRLNTVMDLSLKAFLLQKRFVDRTDALGI